MTNRFHNPYHFISVLDEPSIEDLPAKDLMTAGNRFARHDQYRSESFSGRIYCRITTETPIFVGAEEKVEATKKRPREVAHFTLDGKPAIPASSLRGMISSLAEAASNSCLRVLEPQVLSRRMERSESLSAVGMIVEKPDSESKFGLLPLALPTLRLFDKTFAAVPKKDGEKDVPDFEATEVYRRLFPDTPRLKVYIGSPEQIVREDFHRTFSWGGNRLFHYESLTRLEWKEFTHRGESGWALKYDSSLRAPNGFVVAQNPSANQAPQRGIHRVLGCWGARARKIPIRQGKFRGKSHELFLPFPEEYTDAEAVELFKRSVDLPKDVVETFHKLADQAQDGAEPEQLLPYEPKDTLRNVVRSDNRFRLKDGDLVFFEARAGASGTPVIARISLSSIWRDCVRKRDGTHATTHDFFRGKVDLSPSAADRDRITLAEQLFGFVSQARDRGGRKNGEFSALAGRVRFSDAVLEDRRGGGLDPGRDDPTLENAQLFEQEGVTLKILASPKPPCPSLYFSPKESPAFIAKKELNLTDHRPLGRKTYLHPEALRWEEGNLRLELEAGKEPWRTGHDKGKKARFKQKVRIHPLVRGVAFKFHVDYENLSETELQLLCFALRPSPKFIHKIGMGKPIGLGSVSIEPTALQQVDRARRYSSDGLQEPRFSEVWTSKKFEGRIPSLPPNYAVQKMNSPENLAKKFLEKMNPSIAKAFELLGDPDSTRSPVSYPHHGPDEESENFRWFVRNDEERRQSLKPITEDSEGIDLLELN